MTNLRTEALNKAVISEKNAQTGNIGAGCRTVLGSGSKEVKDVTHYFAFDASNLSGGATEVNKGLTAQVDGVNSFDGQELKGRDFVIDSIAIRFSNLAPAALDDGTAPWNQMLTPQLKNSTLLVEQDGRPIICLLLDDMHNCVDCTFPDEWYRGISNSPIILRDTKFQIKLQPPVGGVIPADNLIKILFRGTEMR